MRRLIPLALLSLAACSGNSASQAPDPETAAIDSAVTYLTQNYPDGQLADVYKSFFQDAFGPKHLLSDTAHSRYYLEYELADTAAFHGPLYEPTGMDGNYYRVNLSVIRDSIVPYRVYLDAFINSLEAAHQPTDAEWRARWAKVDSTITARGIHFADEEADRDMLARVLDTGRNGDFTVHHSDRYNDTYRFHYRIIARDIFETRILPMLDSVNK